MNYLCSFGQDPEQRKQRGYNDDLVISFSTGLWVRDTALKVKTTRNGPNKNNINPYKKESSRCL